MPFEVRMPQLGMAQESGRLVAWLKAVGDRVTSDDPLMEVETDKTTVEVPAGADGVLAELRVVEDTDVAVGDVVAVIAAEGETVSPSAPAAPVEVEVLEAAETAPAETALPSEAPAVERDAATEVVDVPAPVPTTSKAAPPPRGTRILSSPKARRLALEQGVDLGSLVASGVPEPIHVRDLARASVPVPSPGPEPVAAPSSVTAPSLVTACCDSSAFDSFLTRASDEGGLVIEPHILVAGFAAAALRLTGAADQIVVSVETATKGRRISYLDPDLSRPSSPRLAAEDALPSIQILDLTGTRITSAIPAGASVPTVSIAGGGGHAFSLTLAFAGTVLTMDDAIGLLENLAERLEAPLRSLV